ncbi:MAG TPA: pentapeptide repeat-containing protein [Baekduia sp.]|nr:pentapeptide repeat-containing protein [Baekduia sp.]
MARHDQIEAPRMGLSLIDTELDPATAAPELELVECRATALEDQAPLDVKSLDIAECELHGIDFAPGHLSHVDIYNSRLTKCDLSNLTTRRGSLRRVEISESRMLGLGFGACDADDLRVQGGTLMLASFEQARLQRVVFDGVNLRETTFREAQLDGVAFLGCDLSGADFRGARLRNCVLRGSSLDEIVGVDSLRGLAMPWPDLIASTATLAAALGIAVEE